MKKTIFKILSAVGASILLLTSCASSPAALTYKDHVITENEFMYYLATYKASYLNIFSDFKDTASFYSSELSDSGLTGEEFIFQSILRNVKMSLICDALADEHGLKLASSTVEAIDEYLEDFIKEYSNGSKAQFNQALSKYGINVDMLREIYLRDERGAALYSYLYGSNGKIGVTDDDREEYLNENYVRIRHIYVNNSYKYVFDEDGDVKTNTDGSFQTTTLTEDELLEKNAIIASIDAALESGDSFEAVYNTYSEDKYYENGYYISRDMNFVEELVISAFELELGSYVKLESDVGTHYIMRLEMDEKPWSNEKNADFFDKFDLTVSNQLFSEYIESFIDEVVVNDEILNTYSVEKSPVNFRF